jgi:hypothetical protein
VAFGFTVALWQQDFINDNLIPWIAPKQVATVDNYYNGDSFWSCY